MVSQSRTHGNGLLFEGLTGNYNKTAAQTSPEVFTRCSMKLSLTIPKSTRCWGAIRPGIPRSNRDILSCSRHVGVLCLLIENLMTTRTSMMTRWLFGSCTTGETEAQVPTGTQIRHLQIPVRATTRAPGSPTPGSVRPSRTSRAMAQEMSATSLWVRLRIRTLCESRTTTGIGITVMGACHTPVTRLSRHPCPHPRGVGSTDA